MGIGGRVNSANGRNKGRCTGDTEEEAGGIEGEKTREQPREHRFTGRGSWHFEVGCELVFKYLLLKFKSIYCGIFSIQGLPLGHLRKSAIGSYTYSSVPRFNASTGCGR